MFRTLLVGLVSVGLAFGANADVSKEEFFKMMDEYVEQNGEKLSFSIANYLAEKKVKDAEGFIAEHTPTYGPDDAKVTIIEFSEYECPFCGRAQKTLKQLREKYDGKVRFAYKHFPLEAIHPNARGAARAAQAAHRQGKFWEFADEMWANQSFIGEKLIVETAEKLKLDMDKFNKDRNSKEINDEVDADMIDGDIAGARGTPYFLVNGEVLSGAQPVGAFEKIIEPMLKR